MNHHYKRKLSDHNRTGMSKFPIELVTMNKGESRSIAVKTSKIVFVLEGELMYSFDGCNDGHILKGQFMFLKAYSLFSCTAKSNLSLLLVHHFDMSIFQVLYFSCNNEMPEFYMQEEEIISAIPVRAYVNKVLGNYLDSLVITIKEGVCDDYYYKVKAVELFYLLKLFYPESGIAGLFANISSCDDSFVATVMNNYRNFDNIKEFAWAVNLSPSGFSKRFKRVFGMPVYKWMKQQKVNKILQELTCGTKDLKELSYECGFAGPSQFSDFCKNNFGLPPGKIRKRNMDFTIGWNEEKVEQN